MKKLIFTTLGATLIFFVIGYLWGVFHTKPVLVVEQPDTIQERPKVALGAAAVARFFIECGIQGADHARVRDFLLNEEPQEIDLSTQTPQEAIEEHIECLSDTEIKRGIQNKKNINQMLIDKASRGVAEKKNPRDYVIDPYEQ